MKKLLAIILIINFTQIFAASWQTKKNADTIYADLSKTHKLKTFFMKKKKSSEYFMNSLKQLTYRAFWNEKVIQGSVDIEEIPAEDLEFILDRELSELDYSNLSSLSNFTQLNFYLGTHDEKTQSCVDLILFDTAIKQAAIYSECF